MPSPVFDFTGDIDSGTQHTSTASDGSTTVTITSLGSDVWVGDWTDQYGSTGEVVTAQDFLPPATEMTLTFSQPVNLTSLVAFDKFGNPGNWLFTPNVGVAVLEYVGAGGALVDLSSLVGITSLTITEDMGDSRVFGIDTIIFDVAGSNTDPAIALDNTVLAYTEGDSATQIDAAATLSDADGDSDWDGGKIAVQITANAESSDAISLSDTDGDGTAITISGNDILANGTDIGDLSVTGGTVTGGTLLQITFDADATNASVQEVLQSLRYSNDSDNPGLNDRTITLTATDKNSAAVSDTRTISMNAVNDAPELADAGTTLAALEDVSTVMDLSGISVSDVDTGGDITLTISVADTAASLVVTGAGTTVNNVDVVQLNTYTVTLTGTVAELNSYLAAEGETHFTYTTSANSTSNDTLSIIANDGSANSTSTDLTIAVTGVNDAPEAANKAISLVASGAHTFSLSDFGFSDIDVGDVLNRVYVYAQNIDNGNLKLNSVVVSNGASISAGDIGNLVYTSTAAGTDSFTFAVEDSAGGVSALWNTFIFDVSHPITTTVVDGVEVKTETISEDGRAVEVVTVDPVSGDRQDSNDASSSADLPLHVDNDGEPVTTVSLPTGIGMTAYSNNAARENNGIADLIGMINDVASIRDVNAMTSGGRSFLSLLAADSSELWANEITLTTNSETPPGSPVVIQGNSGGTGVEALVIDASALPPGTVLDLRDVEFAVVVGPATLTGGSGSNVVFAGEGSQSIVLGPDDDELHGGDGDDTVGSEGGDDLIFGDNGNDSLFGGAGRDTLHGGKDNDVVTYDGNMDDYYVIQVNGVITVTSKNDGSDRDTLINVEQVQFADQNFAPESHWQLQAVATLYQQVLGRQADLEGFQWWTNDIDNGLPLGGITLEFLRSNEYINKTHTVFDSLTVEEQIEELYEAVLGREADSDGHAFWLEQANNGSSIELIAGAFVASDELAEQYLQETQWDFIL